MGGTSEDRGKQGPGYNGYVTPELRELPSVWRAHQEARFPASARREPFLPLDARIGAILTACLKTDGIPRPLASEQRSALRRDRDALAAALRSSSLDPQTIDYFSRLAWIIDRVLSP